MFEIFKFVIVNNLENPAGSLTNNSKKNKIQNVIRKFDFYIAESD